MLAWIFAATFATKPQVGLCRSGQIALRFNYEDGDFNGMLHAGTLLVLRNRARACQIEALPHITFVDAYGQAFPIVRNVPPKMLPGPVMLPMTILAGGTVAIPLRWVSGEVFDRSRCFSPARLKVAIGRSTISVRFSGHICGASDQPAEFEQPPLHTEVAK